MNDGLPTELTEINNETHNGDGEKRKMQCTELKINAESKEKRSIEMKIVKNQFEEGLQYVIF